MTLITSTEDQGSTIYAAVIAGVEVSWLTISTETRVIENVETDSDHFRQGLATALWEHANTVAEVLHQQDHHRTPEGDAFAQAVGGETADEHTDYVDVCCICTDA